MACTHCEIRLCETHQARCGHCDKTFCSGCIVICETCGHLACRRGTCSRCSQNGCVHCLSVAHDGCELATCENCKTLCDLCGKLLCNHQYNKRAKCPFCERFGHAECATAQACRFCKVRGCAHCARRTCTHCGADVAVCDHCWKKVASCVPCERRCCQNCEALALALETTPPAATASPDERAAMPPAPKKTRKSARGSRD
jgi:hypothetical protein